MEKLTYTVKEVASVLGIGINQAYELVNTEGFPTLRINGRYLVPRHLLIEWMTNQATKR